MIAVAMALMLAAAPPELDAAGLDARIAASANAAQALQGPLDGTWRVTSATGGALYVLQISDPAGGGSPLEAAWRKPGPGGDVGAASRISRSGGRLLVDFRPRIDGPAVALSLRRSSPQRWRGWMVWRGARRRVMMARAAG